MTSDYLPMMIHYFIKKHNDIEGLSGSLSEEVHSLRGKIGWDPNVPVYYN